MAHADLEAALHEVPFLAPIGLSVTEASAGRIVLRIPADKRTRDFEGHVASGALFVVGELAATLALASHPQMHGRAVRRKQAEITYETTTTRPLLVTAEVTTLPDLTEEEPEVLVSAQLMDRDALVATVTAKFVVPVVR
ncbi:MAG: acyl-coenzyme A thioesterase PaaI-like protein [Myxococcota bacterium]|jgi:acyl-coenzyme A thioesterase PaaI-like protein